MFDKTYRINPIKNFRHLKVKYDAIIIPVALWETEL